MLDSLQAIGFYLLQHVFSCLEQPILSTSLSEFGGRKAESRAEIRHEELKGLKGEGISFIIH